MEGAVYSHLQSIARKHNLIIALVSWNDNTRGYAQVTDVDGKVKKFLSAYGPNITDATIVVKDCQVGDALFLRSQNMDELLGIIDPSKVLVEHPQYPNVSALLKNLFNVLAAEGVTLQNTVDEDRVVLRCSHVFLKMSANTQFVPAHYSYNTYSDKEPTNLILVCTPDGVFVHFDKCGKNLLYIHKDGQANWFKADSTDLKAGGSDQSSYRCRCWNEAPGHHCSDQYPSCQEKQKLG